MNRIMSQIFQSVIIAVVLILTRVTPAFGMDIMILGDSITQAESTQLSFRYNLWTKLIDDGREFNLVGSLDSNYNGNPYWPPHMGQDFDQDHEGHWGWRADEILDGSQGEGSLSEWLAGYTPDIALIHIGSNDVDQEYSEANSVAVIEAIVADIEAIIDTLQADNSEVVVFLAKLIPWNEDRVNEGIIKLNAEIDEIASRKSTANSPVWVVDQYSGFNVTLDTYDGIHPNASGEEKMAQKWHDAMQTYLNPCMDGLDNDGDGFIDFPADPNCLNPQGNEVPAIPGILLLLLGS